MGHFTHDKKTEKGQGQTPAGRRNEDLQDLHFGVPQGSVLGPFLFCLYTTSISKIITTHNVSHHMYADDTQVYIELSQSDTHKSISSLSDCLTDCSLWMKSSKLMLNSDKTEFIIIDTKQQRHKLSNHLPVKLLDNDICPSDSVRNLGVVFESDFSFHKHVSNIYKSCFYTCSPPNSASHTFIHC